MSDKQISNKNAEWYRHTPNPINVPTSAKPDKKNLQQGGGELQKQIRVKSGKEVSWQEYVALGGVGMGSGPAGGKGCPRDFLPVS